MNSSEPKIQIPNIQQELQKKGSSGQTYLFNLIVFSPGETRTRELESILNRVTEKFPCRIIQIEKINAKDANEIQVSVSKEEFGKVNSRIYSDLISIKVSESQLERVPFIIIPNIVADLPVYFISLDDPTLNTKTLEALEGICTRLIFDGQFAEHLQSFSERMIPFLKKLKIETMDITWGLLSGWKDVLTGVFDSEEKIEILRHAKKIRIGYCYEKQKDFLSAIYLQGFIASEMGWELIAEEIQHGHQKALCYRYQNKDINVILEPDHQHSLKPGMITYFELTAEDGTIYSMNAHKDSPKVILHITSPLTCEMPCTYSMPDVNRGFNFLKEIFYQNTSDHYRRMLEMIAKVDWEK